MRSKQRRKANRNFIHGAKKEIREILGEALMNGGRVGVPLPPAKTDFVAHQDYVTALMKWWVYIDARARLEKKMLSAGLIDRAGKVTPKGLEVLK